MRIAFLGMGGPFSLGALDAACASGRVTTVLQATPPRGRRARLAALAARVPGLGARDPLRAAARAAGARFVTLAGTGQHDDQAQIAGLDADVLVVAGCPFLISDDARARFPLGAINVHPALLPRHRGLLPYFWIYWHGDAESGVTAHRMVHRADAGPMLAQARFDVPRGWPVMALNEAVARVVGPTVREALAAAAAGAAGTPQDDAAATRAPALVAGAAMVPFAEWDGARAWHLLHGVQAFYREPLHDTQGAPVRYATVGAFTPGAPPHAVGTVRVAHGRGTLAVRDGTIALDGVHAR